MLQARKLSISAEKAIYHEGLASFDDSELYDQVDATGFIKCFGLPMKVKGIVDRRG